MVLTPSMRSPGLALDSVLIRRGDNPVLVDVSWTVGSPGIALLVGAGGAGKSTLLRALAGSDDADFGELDVCGYIAFGAAARHRRVWVPQHVRLEGRRDVAETLRRQYGVEPAAVAAVCGPALPSAGWTGESCDTLAETSRRLLAVMAILCRDGDLYLVDEPTAGLDEAGVAAVRARLRALAAQACVVVVTHNRQDCLELGGCTALLAGGRIQECRETTEFFDDPQTEAARRFVRHGYCNLPLQAGERRREQGIWSVVPGLLYGMSRPGLTASVSEQAHCLVRLGVVLLVGLEEQPCAAAAEIRAAGVGYRHFAVNDMGAPSFAQAVEICRAAEAAIVGNRGVAVHCRGGLGRSGTALAAILIWFGDTADTAVERVRRAEPLAIQSRAQTNFLNDFADRVAGWH